MAFTIVLPLSAENIDQPEKHKVNVSFEKLTIIKCLEKLEGVTGVNFYYNTSDLSECTKLYDTSFDNHTLPEILDNLLHNTGLEFKEVNNNKIVVRRSDNYQGKIKGRVTDEDGQPIVGANVVEVATFKGAVTDFDGNFELVLPPGEYTIRISFVSFQTQEITKVVVEPGKTTPLPVVLKEENMQIEGVVVKAEYKRSSVEALYAKQKAVVSMTDGMSADMIKKTSDNNVAQSLKRIVGVNVSKGKYVVIRGMGERYNNVELNGASMPSTEPNRRNFAFDIIPTSVVDNVLVYKTFMPDMQGEFSGGLVKVNTLSIPNKKVLKISLGTGFNTQSTGKDFYSLRRYNEDYFISKNKRNWYNESWSDNYNQTYSSYFDNLRITNDPQKQEIAKKSLVQLREMGKKIPNDWGVRRFAGAPTQSYSLQWGVPFKLRDNSTLGFVTSITYRHAQKREDYISSFNEPDLESWESDDGIRNKFITNCSALLNIGWKNTNNQISWKNFYNYRFINDYKQNSRDYSDVGIDYYGFRSLNNPLYNTIMQTRLEGRHKMAKAKLEVDWFGDYNTLDRYMPEARFGVGMIRMIPAVDGKSPVAWRTYGPNNEVISSTHLYSSSLNETKHNFGGNIKFKFNLLKQSHFLKTGYWGTHRHAHFYQSRFYPSDKSSGRKPIQDLWSDETYNNEEFIYEVDRYSLNISGSNKYDGEQHINAVYLMGSFNFLKKLQLTGGIRLESTQMTVEGGQQMVIGGPFIDTTLTWNDKRWLPGATLTYNVTKKIKVKAAYGKTLARPDFRERTGIKYFDLINMQTVRGGKGVENTITDNYDLRLEWFPSNKEVVSVNAFYKDFKNIVENYIVGTTGGYSVFIMNLDKAITKGLEFNFRKTFDMPAINSELVFSGNAIVMEGEVLLLNEKYSHGENISTFTSKRLIRGLAPESYNAGIEWNSKHFSLAVNYNQTGRILLFTGGNNEYENQYLAKSEIVGAQVRFRLLNNKLGIKLNANNLFNEPSIRYDNYQPDEKIVSKDPEYNKGDRIFHKGYTGRSYSMSISYTL